MNECYLRHNTKVVNESQFSWMLTSGGLNFGGALPRGKNISGKFDSFSHTEPGALRHCLTGLHCNPLLMHIMRSYEKKLFIFNLFSYLWVLLVGDSDSSERLIGHQLNVRRQNAILILIPQLMRILFARFEQVYVLCLVESVGNMCNWWERTSQD